MDSLTIRISSRRRKPKLALSRMRSLKRSHSLHKRSRNTREPASKWRWASIRKIWTEYPLILGQVDAQGLWQAILLSTIHHITPITTSISIRKSDMTPWLIPCLITFKIHIFWGSLWGSSKPSKANLISSQEMFEAEQDYTKDIIVFFININMSALLTPIY